MRWTVVMSEEFGLESIERFWVGEFKSYVLMARSGLVFESMKNLGFLYSRSLLRYL